MPDINMLWGFIAAALVILVIPGPGVLYILTRSLGQGQRAGFISVLGLSTGALVHVAAATAGLSAVLVASATGLGVVKMLGGGYLIYLGIRTLAVRPALAGAAALPPSSMSRLFTDGVIVSVLNPKIAIFFLAFLPQFVDPGRGAVPRQMLFLGLLYVALALVTDGTYAFLAGRLRHWMTGRVAEGPLPRYATGCAYIGLGISAAVSGRSS